MSSGRDLPVTGLKALPASFLVRAAELKSRYPSPRSALLMLLHEAQDEAGYLSADVLRDVAALMDLDPADVAGVATFYTMFKRYNPGRYLISLCTNVGCGIWGADATAGKLRELLGEAGQTPSDGAVSWEPVECLAYCGMAPAAQVNYCDVRYLTPERAEALIAALRAGRELSEVLAELNSASSFQEASNA